MDGEAGLQRHRGADFFSGQERKAVCRRSCGWWRPRVRPGSGRFPPPMNLTTTLAFITLSALLRAQTARPFYSAEPLSSPRMAALAKAIEGANRAPIITSFLDEVRKAGTPLVEPVAGDPQYSWVTF